MAGIDYRAYLFIAPVALLVLAGAFRGIWRYRRRHIAISLIWYVVMVGAYLTANYVELVSPTPGATVVWARISLHFLLGSGLAWLALAMNYAGFESYTTWRYFRWPTLGGIAIMGFLWTNPSHHLFWLDPGVFTVAGLTTIRPSHGPVFWVYGFYLYLLLLVGVVLFLSTGARGRRLIRQQSWVISLAALIPIAFNLLYVFDLIPSVQKDYSPVAFALSGFLFYLAVNRFGAIRVGPVHHQLVLEDVPSAVITVDMDRTLLDFNNPAGELLRVDDTSIGKSIDEQPRLAALVQDVPLAERNNFEASWTCPDGREGHFDVWIKPIHHLSGRPAGAIITISDVSSWVALLEDRNRAYEALEEERNRLVQLQMQLQRRERLATIGQISAGMAHEISNPLTYVRSGFREMARANKLMGSVVHGESEAPSSEYMEEIATDVQTGLDRIEGVVRSLLDYARGVSRGRTRTPVDFAAIVANTVALVKPSTKDVEIRVDGSGPLTVVCSGDEISQVLLNLLLNAIQAVESLPNHSEAERKVTIRYGLDHGVLRCEVVDSGPGVPEHLRTQVFDPFFTSRNDDSGTGLGLSISTNIVTNGHGGRLYLEEGLPTTFVMELPMGFERA
jgi:signal transduction histidine kinase